MRKPRISLPRGRCRRGSRKHGASGPRPVRRASRFRIDPRTRLSAPAFVTPAGRCEAGSRERVPRLGRARGRTDDAGGSRAASSPSASEAATEIYIGLSLIHEPRPEGAQQTEVGISRRRKAITLKSRSRRGSSPASRIDESPTPGGAVADAHGVCLGSGEQVMNSSRSVPCAETDATKRACSAFEPNTRGRNGSAGGRMSSGRSGAATVERGRRRKRFQRRTGSALGPMVKSPRGNPLDVGDVLARLNAEVARAGPERAKSGPAR